MLDDAAEMPASQEEHTERLAIVAFTEGGLGAAVREADDGSRWSGLHRRRTPKVEPAAPRGPVMMREFLPPVMFVRGWRARLVQGALVCLIALVAAGFVMRFRGERTPEPVAGSESAGEATLELTLDKVCLSAQKHTWQIKVTGTATAGQIGQAVLYFRPPAGAKPDTTVMEIGGDGRTIFAKTPVERALSTEAIEWWVWLEMTDESTVIHAPQTQTAYAPC